MEIGLPIQEYLDYCKYQKNLSDDTLKAYRIDLRQFAAFWAGTDRTFTRTNVSSYIVHLQKTFQPRTAKRKAASLKAFCFWREYMDLLERSPSASLRVKFNEPLILPRTIPVDCVAAILSAAHQAVCDGHPGALRDAAVLELLFATGIRVSELCSLPPQSVDLAAGTVLIMGKGARERVIQVENQDVLSALRDYYFAHQDTILAAGHFFVNRCGRGYSDQSVRAMIRKYLATAHLGIHVTPHMFRHTCATELLEADVDLRYIQVLLGHSSISTTQIYTHVTGSKQRRILAAKHPRNRLELNYG